MGNIVQLIVPVGTDVVITGCSDYYMVHNFPIGTRGQVEIWDWYDKTAYINGDSGRSQWVHINDFDIISD